MREFKLLIDGRLVDGASTMDVINPATGTVLARCPRASAAQAEMAISAANAAFPAWSARPWKDRSALLLQLADDVEGAIDEAVIGAMGKSGAQAKMMVVSDNGKPFSIPFSLRGFAQAHDSLVALERLRQ